ncbi:hypothetical protein D9M70_469470 [compost metagenome]
MAGGGEEPCLADIGLFRGRPGFGEFPVHAGELAGAFLDAQFQRLVRLLQRHVGGNALGDVGIGGDDALVGHGIGSHFDDALAIAKFEQEGLVQRQEVGDQSLFLILADIAALGEDRNDIRERKTHLAGRLRQIEKLAEAPVPDDQVVGVVEDGDALVHLRERGLQHILIVLQRLARLVEQPGRVRRRVVAALQDERKHEPRRRRADGTAEQLLGEMHNGHVRRRIVVQPAAGLALIGVERALHALGAHVAADRRLEIAHRDLGLAAAERAFGARPPGDEDAGLKALDRLRRPGQRAQHIGAAVHEQAQHRGIH